MPGTWHPLKSPPRFGCGTMLLLADGRVLCQDTSGAENGTSSWYTLTPDLQGDYVNGRWDHLQDGSGSSRSHASAVMVDGRVFLAGSRTAMTGEADPLAVELYDPVADSWEMLDLPTRKGGVLDGWTMAGDAPSCVLPDGRVLLGEPGSTRTSIFDPAHGSWAAAGTGGLKNTACGGESWTLLPDGSVLTVTCSDVGASQRYVPSTDAWVDAGPTRSVLSQAGPEDAARTGPTVLLADGRVFAAGASGNTAFYTPVLEASGAAPWSAGPVLTSGGGSDAILVAADLDGDGTVEIMITSRSEGWTEIRKWDGAAFAPTWMSPSPLNGPAGRWQRSQDSFIAADVDGDGHVEIVIANEANGQTGVLKWDGAALVVVWMSAIPLQGPVGDSKYGRDIFIAADVDGDGRVEIVVANNGESRTSVLKWDGAALTPTWNGARSLGGSAGNWSRGEDSFTAADLDGDGQVEIVIASDADGRTGMLKWDGAVLALVWMSASPLNGSAGSWKRGRDSLVAADVDGDGRAEIVLAGDGEGQTGVLKWNGAALVLVSVSDRLSGGSATSWKRGRDSFIAADVDGDGRAEIVITGEPGWTEVLKWTGGNLSTVWAASGPLDGRAGNWQRDVRDIFIAADIDHDGLVETVVASNRDGWLGILKWTDAGLAPVWRSPSLNLLSATGTRASLLPSGKVLFTASAGPASADPGPDYFIEFSPKTNLLERVSDPPDVGARGDQGQLLLLPSGQVLFSNGSKDVFGSGNIQIYTSEDRPQEDRRPAINSGSLPRTVAAGSDIIVQGARFDGMSQAVGHGDGARVASGHTLARIRHRLTGEVAYCRTSGHSAATSIFFPASLLPGPSDLVIVANGMASDPVAIDVTSVGLLPVWASSSPLNGSVGNWKRGRDRFIAADVDGDGRIEVVIANMADGWTGLLKWDGAALALVWASASPLGGPAGNWKRGRESFIAADVDGDGQVEIVIASSTDGWTGVLKWDGTALALVWASASPLAGPSGNWKRGRDSLIAADVDGDGRVEIVIGSKADGSIGVLKWDRAALILMWASSHPTGRSAGSWSRGQDSLIAADVDGDGRVEIVVTSDADGRTGVLKWDGAALALVAGSMSSPGGTAGNWKPGRDSFIAADVDGDGQVEIVIAGDTDGWTGLLKWDGAVLALMSANTRLLDRPMTRWSSGRDSYTAADVDGDGQVEIVIAGESGSTEVLKWNGAALLPMWTSFSPLDGPAGSWRRGSDTFIAADVDHDGAVEAVVANNNDGWAGLLKWMQ